MELIRFPKDYMHLHEIPSKDTSKILKKEIYHSFTCVQKPGMTVSLLEKLKNKN